MQASEPQTPSESQTPSGRRRAWRYIAWAVLVCVGMFLLVPLVWPVPDVPDAVEPEVLARPDSRFAEIEGLRYHYEILGEADCAVIFLHGFAASTFSWRDILPDAAARCTAIAYDRPGFGLTERPLQGDWQGPNPYGLTTQADHVIAMMDALSIESAVLVGHSAGGSVAVLTAARHPSRIDGLILEAPAIYAQGGPPGWIQPLLRTPQARRVGPLLVRRLLSGPRGEQILRDAWAEPSAVTSETVEGYRQPQMVRDWDRALWEFMLAPRPDDPADALAGVECPVVVIAGDSDRFVPYEDSVRIARELDATLVTFPDTGHLPHEEQPDRFSTELFRFLDSLDEREAL